MTGTPSREGAEPAVPQRPSLGVPPLAAWWIVGAGVLAAMFFVLTDQMLRATTAFGGTLALAAVLRLTLPPDRVGGIAVRGRWVDAITLLVLAVGVLLSGFTLDLTAR